MPATFSIPKLKADLQPYALLAKKCLKFFFYAEGILMMAQVI
jgi:hypothetical protein